MNRFAFLILILFACDKDRHRASFPVNPAALSDLNSAYDDFNAALPIEGETTPLCFSSSRNSSGEDFDIIYHLLSIEFNTENGKLVFAKEENGNLDVYSRNRNLEQALPLMNTSGNEWGPYLIPQGMAGSGANRFQSYLILYSSDLPGDHNIFLTTNTSGEYHQPMPVSILNSDFDEAYPTINADSSYLLFCSNREGHWNIYSAALDQTKPIKTTLLSHQSPPFLVASLSSSSDDRCPFLFKNMVVFTSDRPGGFGGFDLYYAIRKEDGWTEPVNFGPSVNSEFQ